jgi:hypothetical protein
VDPAGPLLGGRDARIEGVAARVEDEPGAHDAVVEPEQPQPATLEDVVERCVVAMEGVVLHAGPRPGQEIPPGGHAVEVGVEGAGVGVEAGRGRREAEGPGHHAGGAGGIHDEPCLEPERLPVSPTFQGPAAPVPAGRELGVLEVGDPVAAGLGGEEGVHVRPMPLRVAVEIAGAGGDQELVPVVRLGLEALTVPVMEVAEAALQPDPQLRVVGLPGAVRRQGAQAGQPVPVGQGAEDEVGRGRGGLADGEPGVGAPVDQRGAEPQARQDQRHQASAEAGAQYGDIGVDPGHGQWSQCTGDRTLWERFIRRNRSRHSPEQ